MTALRSHVLLSLSLVAFTLGFILVWFGSIPPSTEKVVERIVQNVEDQLDHVDYHLSTITSKTLSGTLANDGKDTLVSLAWCGTRLALVGSGVWMEN